MAVNINQTGTEFVGQINSDIATAAQSGGSGVSTLSRTVKMQLQGGKISSGYTAIASSANDFFKYCHTTLMLGIENCAITGVTTLSGETLTIFCYNANGAYTSSVSDVDSIPSGTCFVKFMIYNSATAYASLRQLEVAVSGKPTFHKNGVPTLVDQKLFSFETIYPSAYDTKNNTVGDDLETDAGSYIGVNADARYYDNGLIALPPNYSPDGEPVPLVIYCHGTNGWANFTTLGSSATQNAYKTLREFIINNGYAICDCTGLTNNGSGSEVFYAPSGISCVTSLLKFVTANYNVRDDGYYAFGKSSGGFLLHMLAARGVKLKAVASLAPAISFIANFVYNYNQEPTAMAFARTQLGIPEKESGDSTLQYLTKYIHQWRQVDPLFANADLTDAQVESLASTLFSENGVGFGNLGKRDFSKSANCMAVFNATRSHIDVPTKIWVAQDDDAVQYGIAKIFVDMAQSGGSPVYLRRMPNSTGGHHSVDTSSSAMNVPYKPKYTSSSVTIPVAYAELVDWFNRW